MQARAFGCGDDEGRGACAFGLRNLDVAIGAERRGDAVDGVAGLAAVAFEIAAGDGDAQTVGAALEQRRDRLGRPFGADRIVGVETLHRIVGEREIARGARERPEMIEARHEGKGARAATAGRKSASNRICRTARTARGSNRWCRSRARAAPARRRPPRPSRRTSRRSCG